MPALAVSFAPSQRIRWTMPLTVMRVVMVTLLFTTYQVVLPAEPHVTVLSLFSTTVQSLAVFVVFVTALPFHAHSM